MVLIDQHTDPEPATGDRRRRLSPGRWPAQARELIDSASPPMLIAGYLLVALTITLTTGAVIIELLDEVMDPDEATTPDQRIVDWVSERRSPALTTLFRTATHFGATLTAVLVVTAAVVALIATRRRGAAAALFTASAGTMLVTNVLKEIIGRERPPIASRLVDAAGHAFPSGHSSQAVALWGGLALVTVLVTGRAWLRAAATAAAAAIAVVVGLSRTYLGVHWPSDVLSGWIVGLTWVTLVAATTLLLRRLDRPRRWWPRPD